MNTNASVAQAALVARIRRLTAGHAVREVAMFGGVSFMVDDALAVAARQDGSLLVKATPEKYDQHLDEGASPAMMRADRPMGRGWMSVEAAQLTTDAALARWVEVGIIASARP